MGFIDQFGKYHKEVPALNSLVTSKTSVWRSSDHDRQRADHKLDLLNPFDADGNLSSEFIAMYPDEAVASYGFNPDKNLELKKEG